MWFHDPYVLALTGYMKGKGCEVLVDANSLIFIYEGESKTVLRQEVETALHYAYRIAWEPETIRAKFEQYLISLYKQRVENEEIT